MCVCFFGPQTQAGPGQRIDVCGASGSVMRAVETWEALSLPWRLPQLIERDAQNMLICAIGTKRVG